RILPHSAVPQQIGIVYPVALGVTGSTTSFVEGLTVRAQRLGRRWDWADLDAARAEWEAERKAQLDDVAEPIVPPFVAHTIRKVLPTNGLIVTDAGNAAKHMRVHFDAYEPRTFMYSDEWGSVGCG